MSTTTLSLRLTGHLPPLEELTHLLGRSPTFAQLKGTSLPWLTRPEAQERHRLRADVWSLDLIEWEGSRADEQGMGEVAAVLQHMAPILASLERSEWRAQLYISTIREEEQGGFDIPTAIIVAAGLAKLELIVSILVGMNVDEEDESAKEE